MNQETTYINFNEPRGEEKCSLPMASMTDMMRDVNMMAYDALCMSRRINAHLFGVGKPLCEKEADPKCFRDELEKARCELMSTVEELSKICAMLGM